MVAREIHIRDGFEGQRLVRSPDDVHAQCRRMPLARELYVTDIGHFPNTLHHYVDRPEGCPNTIFIYNARGRGWVALDGQRWEVPPEHGVMIPAGRPHAYGAHDRLPWEIYWIHFNGRKVSSILEALEISCERPLVFVPEIDAVTEAFEDVFRWTGTGFTDAALIAMSAALLRFFSLVNAHRSAPGQKTRQTVERINHVIHLMHERLSEPATLTQWAREARLSTPQFCSLFRRQTGCTPMRFFSRLRMQKACQLLDLTDLPVNAVAREVGMEDPFHFCRLFKKMSGVPPREYRRKVKG